MRSRKRPPRFKVRHEPSFKNHEKVQQVTLRGFVIVLKHDQSSQLVDFASDVYI
jgi:hypothetical protein